MCRNCRNPCVWLCVPGDRAKLRPHRVASDCQFWTVAQPSVGTPGMEESVLHAGGHGDSLGEQLRPSRVIRVCVCITNASYMSVCGLQGVWGVLRQCSKRVALCFSWFLSLGFAFCLSVFSLVQIYLSASVFSCRHLIILTSLSCYAWSLQYFSVHSRCLTNTL